MNKVVVGSIVLLIIVVSLGFYLNSKKNSNSEKMMVKDSPKVMVEETPDSMMKDKVGKYIEYKDPSTLEIKNSKTVLFFYANWCPTCIPVDKEFSNNLNKIPEDVKVVRVNYNDPDTDENEKTLARKYGITYQHTFVQIDENGDVVTKWNGGGLDKLLSNVK